MSSISLHYAWTTLCMLNDDYIPGVIALALSLKNEAKSEYPLICMVTEGVSEKGIAILSEVCDYIVRVPILQTTCYPLGSVAQQHLYEKWISKSFSKWNCLGFYKGQPSFQVLHPSVVSSIEVEQKVCFLDADVICMHKDCDTLFSLNAPAGNFSNPRAKTYQDGQGFNNAFEQIEHGEPIDSKLIQKNITDSFALIGSSTVLQPNESDYIQLVKWLKESFNEKNPFGWRGCTSGHDEQCIAMFYTIKSPKTWTMVDQRFNHIPWETSWQKENTIPIIYHYPGNKPWNRSEFRFESLKVWWTILKRYIQTKQESKLSSYITSLKDHVDKEYSEFKKDRVSILLKNYVSTTKHSCYGHYQDARILASYFQHHNYHVSWIRHFSHVEKDRKRLYDKLKGSKIIIGFDKEALYTDVVETIQKLKQDATLLPKDSPEYFPKPLLYWVPRVNRSHHFYHYNPLCMVEDVLDLCLVRTTYDRIVLKQQQPWLSENKLYSLPFLYYSPLSECDSEPARKRLKTDVAPAPINLLHYIGYSNHTNASYNIMIGLEISKWINSSQYNNSEIYKTRPLCLMNIKLTDPVQNKHSVRLGYLEEETYSRLCLLKEKSMVLKNQLSSWTQLPLSFHSTDFISEEANQELFQKSGLVLHVHKDLSMDHVLMEAMQNHCVLVYLSNERTESLIQSNLDPTGQIKEVLIPIEETQFTMLEGNVSEQRKYILSEIQGWLGGSSISADKIELLSNEGKRKDKYYSWKEQYYKSIFTRFQNLLPNIPKDSHEPKLSSSEN